MVTPGNLRLSPCDDFLALPSEPAACGTTGVMSRESQGIGA